MKLEDQVVSLGLAKKLKELGFKQESLFYWMRQDSEEKEWGRSFINFHKARTWMLADFGHEDSWMGIQPEHFVSTYTVSELGKMLGEQHQMPYLTNNKMLGGLKWYLVMLPVKGINNIIVEETESDARAKMLIYLKEQGLL